MKGWREGEDRGDSSEGGSAEGGSGSPQPLPTPTDNGSKDDDTAGPTETGGIEEGEEGKEGPSTPQGLRQGSNTAGTVQGDSWTPSRCLGLEPLNAAQEMAINEALSTTAAGASSLMAGSEVFGGPDGIVVFAEEEALLYEREAAAVNEQLLLQASLRLCSSAFVQRRMWAVAEGSSGSDAFPPAIATDNATATEPGNPPLQHRSSFSGP
ncbi:unnamed protein product, partial [Symbiodinium sp. KB8]